MSNPMNKLKARAELAEAKYNKLIIRHEKLLVDSIELENKVQDYEGAISSACDGCAMKDTAGCFDCSLNKVAMSHSLWRE